MIQTEVEENRDILLAKEIAETLHEHYPGHLWAVFIKNYYLSDQKCMVLHYDKLGDATTRKKRVIMSGGEFLERYNVKRGAYELA